MSEAESPGLEPRDHREDVDWLAVSSSSGTDKHLHRVDGDPDRDELTHGEEVDVACDTSLADDESYWKAKPAAVFPPGFAPLCKDERCFGDVEE